MLFRDANGKMREYGHRFQQKDLDRLHAFLQTALAVFPLREAKNFGGENLISIRHDVDHNLDHAVKFARWETERGYRSTYFVLHTAWYYADRDKTRANCETLVELGHEVGLHNDTVAATWQEEDALDGAALPAGHCERAAALMREELDRLRSWGIPVVGTAAHGTPLFREKGIHNNDLWSAGWTPADFGLEYEAYHVHRGAHYVSDNHGRWRTPLGFVEGKQTHVLIHPCHWPV